MRSQQKIRNSFSLIWVWGRLYCIIFKFTVTNGSHSLKNCVYKEYSNKKTSLDGLIMI